MFAIGAIGGRMAIALNSDEAWHTKKDAVQTGKAGAAGS